jgi:tryptophan synthase beta subunit
MVTQSTIFMCHQFFDYQVVIINMTKISYEHNDVALLRLYTAKKPHPYPRVSRRFESIITLQVK